MGHVLDNALAILNGAIGDRLARDANELALTMTFVRDGASLRAKRDDLARAYPHASPRVVVLLHGLMCTESFWEDGEGETYGSRLERDLGASALFVRYNTGLPIADNGAALASLLEGLVEEWPLPIEEIILLGHSMGGLVARSACHRAATRGDRWLALVKRAIYVGTPHRGAPLERAGRIFTRLMRAVPDPYTQLVGTIGDLRSEGVKDLGDADILPRTTFGLTDPRHPVPLLPSIDHCLIAGSVSPSPILAQLFGDAIVPIASATNGACSSPRALPPAHVRLVPGASHIELARSPLVYAHVKSFCQGASA